MTLRGAVGIKTAATAVVKRERRNMGDSWERLVDQ